MAAQTSSATAPATAAIGVMKFPSNRATAEAMRRAVDPANGSPSSGRRRSGSSATSSSRIVSNRLHAAS